MEENRNKLIISDFPKNGIVLLNDLWRWKAPPCLNIAELLIVSRTVGVGEKTHKRIIIIPLAQLLHEIPRVGKHENAGVKLGKMMSSNEAVMPLI